MGYSMLYPRRDVRELGMSRSEARQKAAERRRSRIKQDGGRIVQVALRAPGAEALAALEERTGQGPSAIVEQLLIEAAGKDPTT